MRYRTIAATTLIVAVTASVAIACSVPVFRYALEHWRPDPYVLFVFTEDEPNKETQEILDTLQVQDQPGQPIANLAVRVVNLKQQTDPITQQIRQAHPSDSLPWAVLQTPAKWGPPQTVWQGELTAANAARILQSPARSTISRRLVDGESVVWVLLECGREEEDEAAFSTLTSELARLQTKLKLPEIASEDLGDLSVDPDALKIAFSAIRIARDDPQEQVFVDMLLRVEPDLLDEDVTRLPLAFPIFGRGRALYALAGKGIAGDVIEEACQFLTGACQCTVKAQNPGVDLLLNVNWDDVVVPTKPIDDDLPPLAGFSGFAAAEETPFTSSDAESGVTTAATVSRANMPNGDAVANGDQISQLTVADPSVNNSVAPDTASPALTSSASASSDSTSDVTAPAAVAVADQGSPAAGIGQNVLFLLMVLVVGVVIASLFLAPRSN
ncbi:MAG: hypothetical protein RIK87_11150 [Fuerstiella sp.]